MNLEPSDNELPPPGNYEVLHGLPMLRKARERCQVPPASSTSALRATLQAVELGLFNVADLLYAAAASLSKGELGNASVRLSWVRGFHRLVIHLSGLPWQYTFTESTVSFTPWRPMASLGVAEFLAAQKRFDEEFKATISDDKEALTKALSLESLDHPLSAIIHWLRVSNHEAAIWEGSLSRLYVPAVASSYHQFVGAEELRNAVGISKADRSDFLTQFRGLHQIPETLAAEAGDHVEAAIQCLRAGNHHRSIAHLRLVNVFMEAINCAAGILVDHLATADYHAIRDNLQAQTSGLHSVAIHYHLFGDLYSQLISEVCSHGTEPSALTPLVIAQCVQLRMSILGWRDAHFHWPRNHLGSKGTRSLIGSDGLALTNQFRAKMPQDDQLNALAESHGLSWPATSEEPVESWFARPDSIDSYLLDLAGEVARQRFPDVQTRSGPYSQSDQFEPPPRRIVSCPFH